MKSVRWMWVLGLLCLGSVGFSGEWTYSSDWAREMEVQAAREHLAKGDLWSELVVLGRQLWQLVSENASVFQPGEEVPVVHVLPAGSDHWNALHSWREASTRPIDTQILDPFGGPVMTARYLPVFDCNGRLGQNPGLYLSSATVLLTSFDINGVGLTYSSSVQVREARNFGTEEAPIASVLFEIHHHAEGILREARKIDRIRMYANCEFMIHQESDQW